MQVRTVNVSDADGKSAQLFFDALTGFYDLSAARALDMFARNGQLTVSKYADKVRDVAAWELGPEHESALLALGPNVAVKIGCSYLTASWKDARYDLIVIDSPQGAHKDYMGTVHFEHFDAIQLVKRLAKDRCIVVLYVNRAPYDKNVDGDFGYDQYEEYDFKDWMKARHAFYSHSPYKLTDAAAIHAYAREFAFMGFDVVNTLVVPCYSDHPRKESYAFRLAVELVKRRS